MQPRLVQGFARMPPLIDHFLVVEVSVVAYKVQPFETQPLPSDSPPLSDRRSLSGIGGNGQIVVLAPATSDRPWCCGVGTPFEVDRISPGRLCADPVDSVEVLWGKDIAFGKEGEGEYER